jgi:regulator of sirC expression with transglutaminase-like and TPR domain
LQLFFLSAAPQDHLLLSNRSHAFASLDRFREALEDAERVIKLRPDWPKVSYLKVNEAIQVLL